tara:strand:+ start:1042 stop:1269 length:228 start_codon:yes stop_codon:yes gene_type:complete
MSFDLAKLKETLNTYGTIETIYTSENQLSYVVIDVNTDEILRTVGDTIFRQIMPYYSKLTHLDLDKNRLKCSFSK